MLQNFQDLNSNSYPQKLNYKTCSSNDTCYSSFLNEISFKEIIYSELFSK